MRRHLLRGTRLAYRGLLHLTFFSREPGCKHRIPAIPRPIVIAKRWPGYSPPHIPRHKVLLGWACGFLLLPLKAFDAQVVRGPVPADHASVTRCAFPPCALLTSVAILRRTRDIFAYLIRANGAGSCHALWQLNRCRSWVLECIAYITPGRLLVLH